MVCICMASEMEAEVCGEVCDWCVRACVQCNENAR